MASQGIEKRSSFIVAQRLRPRAAGPFWSTNEGGDVAGNQLIADGLRERDP